MALLSTLNAEGLKEEVCIKDLCEALKLFRNMAHSIYEDFILDLQKPDSFKIAKEQKIDIGPIFDKLQVFQKWRMIPRKNKNHHVNIGEFVNQMANIETLIHAMNFAIKENKNYQVILCSPCSTYTKHIYDSDLLLKDPNKDMYLCFEVSDILDYNSNNKLAKDLNTLHKKLEKLKKKAKYYIFSNPKLFGDSPKSFYLKSSKNAKDARVYKEDNKDNKDWNKKVELKLRARESNKSIGYEVIYNLK